MIITIRFICNKTSLKVLTRCQGNRQEVGTLSLKILDQLIPDTSLTKDDYSTVPQILPIMAVRNV